jgi:hypothetical protein
MPQRSWGSQTQRRETLVIRQEGFSMPSPSRPLWVGYVLAGCLLLSATLMAALLVVNGSAAESSRTTYDQIKMGMLRPEAEAILNDWPQRLVRASKAMATVEWEAPDGARIEVDFAPNGRVTGKHFAESDQRLSARMRRLIKRFPLH